MTQRSKKKKKRSDNEKKRKKSLSIFLLLVLCLLLSQPRCPIVPTKGLINQIAPLPTHGLRDKQSIDSQQGIHVDPHFLGKLHKQMGLIVFVCCDALLACVQVFSLARNAKAAKVVVRLRL
jgi:hypothetical protein